MNERDAKARVKLSLKRRTVEVLDEIVKEGRFVSRSDAVRFLIESAAEVDP